MKRLLSLTLVALVLLSLSLTALAEGKVVAYMPSPAGLADKLAAGFTAKTGIAVEQFQGTTGEILARLEAETATPVADVVILASWADGLAMQKEGKLHAYTPVNADKLHPFAKEETGTLYGTSASAVAIIYNTLLVPELEADWQDLADAKYKDQLAMPDPTLSGAAKDFLAGYAAKFGKDESLKTWQSLVDNGMTIPGANKAVLEACITGEKPIMVAGVDYNAYSSIDKGEALAVYYPASGTVINPRPAMILNTAPNLDNAKLFMDYLLSDEAQQLVADAYLIPGSQEVLSTKRSNVADIPAIEADWTWMMDNAADLAKTISDMGK